MRKAAVALGVTALAVAGWLFAHYQSVPQSAAYESRQRSVDVSDGDSSVRGQPSATTSRPVATGEPPPPAAPNYDKDLKESQDIWQFAEGILASAKSGDNAAQYYLSRALKFCDDGYRFYFDRGAKRRTLDEAMQWASTRMGTSSEDAQAVYTRCRRLKESTVQPFGTADDWLNESKEGGFALAQMDVAGVLAGRLALTAAVGGAKENVEMREEAKRLAREALRSKDPQVVFQFGDLAALFTGDLHKAEGEQWVWRLAACQRGYDCSQQAEWLRFGCRFDFNCQPYESGIDYIRRINGADFDEIERRAGELNAKLDAGDFEDIGI